MTKNPISKSTSTTQIDSILSQLECTLNPQLINEFLSKTIIQFQEPISLHPTHTQISPDLMQAIQDLVQIIAHLRSPNGAWPSNLPQTPENLIPYVSEEVYGLLEAYKQHLSSPEVLSPSLYKSHPIIHIPTFILVKELIPKILWNLAGNSFELMRLLTGIKAEVLLPSQDWETGKLRLVSSLSFTIDALQLSIDLATNTIFAQPLLREAYIQSNDCYLCQNPLRADSLLHQIKNKIKNEILLIQTNKTQILSPKNYWKFAQINLNLELEFIPELPSPKNSILKAAFKSNNSEENLYYNSSEVQNVEYSVVASVSTPALLDAKIRLTDPKIIQPYIQTQIQQYWWCWFIQKNEQEQPILNSFNSSISISEKLNNCDIETENLLLVSFLHIADELVDVIYNPTSISSLTKLQPEISLVELSLRLLWQMVSSSYPLMQLISGIKAKALQPGHDWETGTLRLLAVLNTNFSDETWEVDIATSQTLKFDLHIPAPESIIQSNDCEWCQSPQSIKFLMTQATNLLQTLPEIKSWMDQVKLDWGYPTQNLEQPITWQTGSAQLSIGFEWIKDYPKP